MYRFSIIRVVPEMSRSPADRTSDSQSLVDAFGRFMPVFRRWLELKYEKGTMSYARLKLLGMLHVKGPMIMSELGARLDVSARNITKLVDALEREGLVRRSRALHGPARHRDRNHSRREQGRRAGLGGTLPGDVDFVR